MSAEEIQPQVIDSLNPLAIVDRAIAKGMDADKLGKLIDLAEAWKAARAKEQFALALNSCQAEMPRLMKDAENSHAKSMYIMLETVQKAIMPVYTKHGFSISWSQGEPPREGMTRVLARLYHVGGHSEQYQGDYPIDGVGAKGGQVMNPLQGTVSAHTYAQRDMLRLMFNLTISGQDDDGNQHYEAISEAQHAELEQLIDKAKANTVKFLDWLSSVRGSNIDRLCDLPAPLFAIAKDALTRKAKGKEGGGQ